MENENSATPAPVAENGQNAAQEVVSSTTQPAEPTKRSLRVETWKKVFERKIGVSSNAIFNRIPVFIDANKAAELFSQTDEFKKAQHIKVSADRALYDAKLQTLLANKTLYIPSGRNALSVFLGIDLPADTTEEQKKDALRIQDANPNRRDINLDDKIKLDLIVIGSVVVSRDGYRIGRGNGFTDLDVGLLIEIGVITPETIIATIVHDVQVVDTLPLDLFQKYDTPVDLIITPTEVIRIGKRLPRPSGLYWELLSERRLKIIPILQQLKEIQEKAGKIIQIKDEDTDVEQNQNNRRRRGPLRRRYPRRNPRRATSQTDTEQQGDNSQQKRNPRRRGRFMNRRRRPTKSEGDQSGVEGKSQERKGDGVSGERKQRKPKRGPPRDIVVKLTNLTRETRVKDLKTELRKRECNPLSITWKGYLGKCFLHFGNRNGTPSTQDDVDKVLKALNDLSLTITTGGGGGAEGGDAAAAASDAAAAKEPAQTKVINVNVELIKFGKKSGTAAGAGGVDDTPVNGESGTAGGDAGAARIESVDTTTV